jgi:dipeptidyl aminopeptidase/acylaminoacyl peptidase
LYGCVIIAAIGAAAAAYLGWGATLGRSEADASPAVAARSSPAAQASSKITFMRDRDGSRGALRGDIEMYVMNPDGSGGQKLTRNASPVGGRPPVSWSPDGRRIAFASERSGNSEIYVMNAERSSTRSTNQVKPWAVSIPPTYQPPISSLKAGSSRIGSKSESSFA